jgi:hypothetical protein
MVASSKKKQKQKTIAAKPIVPGAQLEDGGRKAVRTREHIAGFHCRCASSW